MFYLTTHSTLFIYGYMASDIWLRTILIVRKETRCRHIGYSYRLTASVLLYAPSHSRGALAGTRNSSMGPPHEGLIWRPISPWANALPLSYVPLLVLDDDRKMFYVCLNHSKFSGTWLLAVIFFKVWSWNHFGNKKVESVPGMGSGLIVWDLLCRLTVLLSLPKTRGRACPVCGCVGRFTDVPWGWRAGVRVGRCCFSLIIQQHI